MQAPRLNADAQREAMRRRRRLRTGLLLALMTVIALVMLYPFFFMIETSFKSENQFLNGTGGFSLSSWSQLAQALPWAREMLNSTIVCTCAIVIILLVSTTAGFAFAKLRFRMSNYILTGIVAVNSYFGAVIIYAAIGTPFATFLMTAYYRSLPDEVIEAAIIDGAHYFGVFRRVALPMSIPALVTIAVLQFIQIWDDLLVGLLFLQNPSERTITVGLGALAAGRTTNIPILMAGSLVSAIPAILVFLIFQRFLTTGLTAGVSR